MNSTLLVNKLLLSAHLVLPASFLFAQAPVNITVNDPRPLAAAVDRLEDITGLPVKYEDPRFAAPQDVQDVTTQVQSPQQRAANPNATIIVPKGGPLAVTGETDTGALPLLTELLTQHEASGYPGRFKIHLVSEVLTVEPISVRSEDGTWRTQTAAMDTAISLATQRNAAEALTVIARTLGSRLGMKVGIGRIPMSAFANTAVEIGASDEPAGAVLVRLLRQLSPAHSPFRMAQPLYSYRLLYDPGVRYYLLHIHAVPPRMSQPL